MGTEFAEMRQSKYGYSKIPWPPQPPPGSQFMILTSCMQGTNTNEKEREDT